MTRKIILGELAWNSPQGVTSSTSANLCEVSSGSFLLQVLTEAAESSHLFLCYSWRCEITHFSLHSKLNPAAGVKPFMVSHPWIQFFDTRCLSQLHTAVLSVIWTHIGLSHNGSQVILVSAPLVWVTVCLSPYHRCDKTHEPQPGLVSHSVIALSLLKGFPWHRNRGSH